LLRQCRKRQGGRPTEERDDLAAFHSITSSARASTVAGIFKFRENCPASVRIRNPFGVRGQKKIAYPEMI
jgi:hypothetical protein